MIVLGIAFLQESGALEIATSANLQKVSPDCKLIFKTYYNKCGHLIEKQENIEDAQVNMTKEELESNFSKWEMQTFTSSEIVLYKELNEFCNEHYLLSEKDGYIAIYKLDEKNNRSLIKTTDIALEYLEPKDLEEIKNGITVCTKRELNKTLEDFE